MTPNPSEESGKEPKPRCGGTRELRVRWLGTDIEDDTVPCPGCPDCTPHTKVGEAGEERLYRCERCGFTNVVPICHGPGSGEHGEGDHFRVYVPASELDTVKAFHEAALERTRLFEASKKEWLNRACEAQREVYENKARAEAAENEAYATEARDLRRVLEAANEAWGFSAEDRMRSVIEALLATLPTTGGRPLLERCRAAEAEAARHRFLLEKARGFLGIGIRDSLAGEIDAALSHPNPDPEESDG